MVLVLTSNFTALLSISVLFMLCGLYHGSLPYIMYQFWDKLLISFKFGFFIWIIVSKFKCPTTLGLTQKLPISKMGGRVLELCFCPAPCLHRTGFHRVTVTTTTTKSKVESYESTYFIVLIPSVVITVVFLFWLVRRQNLWGETQKTLEFIYKILCIYSYMFKLQSPSKYSPFDAIRFLHLPRCFFHFLK